MSPPLLTAGIGYAAAVVGSFLMLPQVIQSWRTRHVDDLSLAMVWLYVVNCLLWVVYGGLAHSGPVILANAVGLAIGAAQLAMKLAWAGRVN